LLDRERELKKKAENKVSDILELMLEKNNEIDELREQVENLEEANKKLNAENEDLNNEAVDLENKINLMSKMCQNLQYRDDLLKEKSFREKLHEKDECILRLSGQLEAALAQIQQPETHQINNKLELVSRTVSTENDAETTHSTPDQTPDVKVLKKSQ
jgi:predicted RNase H-like nuclease (RuvC/YqgF family)